ncbi:MAG TPA: hypothetical protein VFZ76_17750 [Anaerolineales bacterium]
MISERVHLILSNLHPTFYYSKISARLGLLILLALLVSGCAAVDAGGTPTAFPGATVQASPTYLPVATMTSAPTSADSGNADVTFVRAVQASDGSWTFHVTVQHPDTGWEDYANGWDVVTPDGTVLKPDPDGQFTRTLLHPHVDEQPFTRSQSGIQIPAGVTQVRVRAHDLVDGYGGEEVVVNLTKASGPGFEVER